jgi:hypothetical protein
MRFEALMDFTSPELASEYVKGLFYTVRPEDEVLAALVPVWESQGKVRLGGPVAELKGEG